VIVVDLPQTLVFARGHGEFSNHRVTENTEE
jgi:hypothetical protein